LRTDSGASTPQWARPGTTAATASTFASSDAAKSAEIPRTMARSMPRDEAMLRFVFRVDACSFEEEIARDDASVVDPDL
jgi:hypothetical protein